jgi:hypothetical protein
LFLENGKAIDVNRFIDIDIDMNMKGLYGNGLD